MVLKTEPEHNLSHAVESVFMISESSFPNHIDHGQISLSLIQASINNKACQKPNFGTSA